jgi:hypothetical protein
LIILNPFIELIHLEGETRGFHETPEKVEQVRKELDLFLQKWKPVLDKGDPYYNPNIEMLRY